MFFPFFISFFVCECIFKNCKYFVARWETVADKDGYKFFDPLVIDRWDEPLFWSLGGLSWYDCFDQ